MNTRPCPVVVGQEAAQSRNPKFGGQESKTCWWRACRQRSGNRERNERGARGATGNERLRGVATGPRFRTASCCCTRARSVTPVDEPPTPPVPSLGSASHPHAWGGKTGWCWRTRHRPRPMDDADASHALACGGSCPIAAVVFSKSPPLPLTTPRPDIDVAGRGCTLMS